MRMRAKVICAYGDGRESRAVAKAVSPDNRAPGGMRISTSAKGANVVSEVEVDGRAETLLATLDDLLACTLTAESII